LGFLGFLGFLKKPKKPRFFKTQFYSPAFYSPVPRRWSEKNKGNDASKIDSEEVNTVSLRAYYTLASALRIISCPFPW